MTRPHVGAYQTGIADAERDYKRRVGHDGASYELGWREGRACVLLKAKGHSVPCGVGSATKKAVRLGLLGG